MAAIQNLEIIVEVNITEALASLTELQEELAETARAINRVDARGAEGIDVDFEVQGVQRELAQASSQIKSFEAMHGIDLATDLGGADGGRLSALLDADFRRGARARRGGGLALGLKRASDRMGRQLRGLTLRMSTLHNLLASLVPLLVVFIGVLPAAANALITLAGAALAAAAAFAAIAGLGALGAATTGGQMPSMEDFSQFWEDIRDGFFEAFAPLAERLAPVFLDALDGLEKFFMAIANEGDALVELTDEARDFGGFLMEFVPAVLRNLAAAVEALEPVLSAFGEFLLEDSEIIRTMVRLTLDAVPALTALSNAIISFLPMLTEISIGFAVVAEAIVAFIGAMSQAMSLLGLSNEVLGITIGSMLALGGAVALVAFVVQSRLGLALARLVKIIFTKVIIALVGSTSAFYQLGAAATVATVAVATLMTVMTLGLAALATGIVISAANDFFNLAEGIGMATNSMKEFNRVSGRTGGGVNPYGGANAPAPGAPTGGAGGSTTVNMESSGDAEKDGSNADKLAWRLGRTSGSRP